MSTCLALCSPLPAPHPDEILSASRSLHPYASTAEREAAERVFSSWVTSIGALRRWVRATSETAVVETLVTIMTSTKSPIEAVSAVSAALAEGCEKDRPFRVAVVADSPALVPAAIAQLKRVMYLPEETAFALFDILRVVLADSTTETAIEISNFLAPDAWSIIAFLCSQNECCVMASGLHIAAANFGATLLGVYARNNASPDAQLKAIAESSGASIVPPGPDSESLRNAALESVCTALVSLLTRAAERNYLPLGPIPSSPTTSALHLLHSIATTGRSQFERFLLGAPTSLLSCIGSLVVADQAPARARLSSARLLYLATTLMNESLVDSFVAANIPAVAISILMHALPPAPLAGSSKRRALAETTAIIDDVESARIGVHLFMSLTIRNLLITPSPMRHGVRPGDPLPDDVKLRGAVASDPAPPPLPAGTALPAVTGPPMSNKVSLWTSLEGLAKNDHAAALIVATLSYAANLPPAAPKGAPSGLRALVSTNGPDLERFIVNRVISTTPGSAVTASRAAFLLWVVAIERARVTASRWAHTRLNWTGWRGDGLPAVPDAWPLPALPSGWKRLETEERLPYYYSVSTRKTQWSFPPASDAATKRPSVGLPFEDNESGLFALRALHDSGVFRGSDSSFNYSNAALPVRLVLAAIAAEALSDAPFICPSADHRIGDGVHIEGVDGANFHWPHIPASNAPDALLELGAATRTFLRSALATIDTETFYDPIPCALFFSPLFAASIGRCARSSISELPAAFAALAIRVFCPLAPALPFEPLPKDTSTEAAVAVFVENAVPIVSIKWVMHASSNLDAMSSALERYQAVQAMFIPNEYSSKPLRSDAAAKLPSTDLIEANGTPFQFAWNRESAVPLDKVLEIVDETGTKTGLRIASSRVASNESSDAAQFRETIDECAMRITERPHD